MATQPIKTQSRDVLGLSETRPLPHKEIIALFAQWRDNDDLMARDQIVASNMRFVAQIAHEYVDTCSLNLDELISEGIQGLFMAADRFDLPVYAYMVSGEYAMIEAMAASGAGDRDTLLMEILTGFKRAGASGVLSYHAPIAARLMG